jgi:transposase-like protein
MVEQVRAGVSMREVGRRFRVSLSVIQRWVRHAAEQRLDRIDWSGKTRAGVRPVNRTARAVELRVLTLREQLAKMSDLGEYGAEAIHAVMLEGGEHKPPSVRTIARIIERSGVLDDQRRVRRTAPPLGWYLPEVAAKRAELDSFDTVSGLVLAGGVEVVVLNGISLHGGLVTSWPDYSITATLTASLLIKHWSQFGLPRYAQFDNDNVFVGSNRYTDVIGRVMRTCLLLGVTPVFAPPREPGFQAAIESLNGRWQAKVWHRFERVSLFELLEHSDRYIAAVRCRNALRIERAPTRCAMPADTVLDLQAQPCGTVIFIRRTDDRGVLSVLGHPFLIDPLWTHRLVRAEVNLDASVIRFFALRRRDPANQPLLTEHPYSLPRRRFAPVQHD